MSNNMLEVGLGGSPAPNPSDADAVPPNPVAMPAPGPSDMRQHFITPELAAKEQFDKAREAHQQVMVMRQELDNLLALGDTVTMDDLVEAAGNMVAKGLPAIQLASSLAEAPEQQSQLQAWVQEKSDALVPSEEMAGQMVREAGFALGKTALESLVGHSAEQHWKERMLAAPAAGRA